MSASAPGPRDPRSRIAAVALAITLAIQMFTSFAATAASVLAPEIGRDLAIAPGLIGVFVGLIYVGSMTASLVSGGFVERYGAIRVSQVCVLLCAAGVTLVAAAGAVAASLAASLVAAALVIGLGYGPITPASSHVLARTASPARMALTFSIKQTGVPAGAALAGALLPAVALATGWRTAFALVAALGIAIAAAAQLTRRALDTGRAHAQALSLAGIFAPLARVVRTPALAELALTAFVYASLQMCLMSFLVVYLTESLAASLVFAGLALTAATVGGVVGRIGWGAVADAYVEPRTLLGLIGLAAGGGAFATAAFGPDWPAGAILAVCAVFGATAIGWNGVQLSELARHSPEGQAGAITGAAGFITFGGVVLGPPTFAAISAMTGGYRTGFVAFGLLASACGGWLLARHRR